MDGRGGKRHGCPPVNVILGVRKGVIIEELIRRPVHDRQCGTALYGLLCVPYVPVTIRRSDSHSFHQALQEQCNRLIQQPSEREREN
jgi:hypothetical protein